MNSCFPPRSGTLHAHLNFSPTLIHRFFGCSFCSHLRGKRCTFPRALETVGSRTVPTNDIPHRVSNSDDRVIKGGLDVCNAFRNVFPFTAALSPTLSPATCHVN